MIRLYYDNAYLTEFKSEVINQTTVDDRPAVILAQSAFYPTSGGQPHDTGSLNDCTVTDVQVRNGDVLHVLDGRLDDTEITGTIHWARRFDHMQHHTGQHILTRAFIETVSAETLSFHLSDNSVTIDIDAADLPLRDIDAAEDLANKIIADNLAVRAWFPTPEELHDINLRKVSEKVTGDLRVVDIGGFDVTACGGTHVAHTGEIGMIKIVSIERNKGNMRIEFTCGQRALQDYRQKHRLLSDLSHNLTTGIFEIPGIIDKTREENKMLQREVRSLRQELLGYRAQDLWAQATRREPFVLVTLVLDADKGDLQVLAGKLVENKNTLAMLGLPGESCHFVFARSEDVDLDVVPLLKTALAALGSDRGGGRPAMAQGGGVPASREQVEQALAAASAQLYE
ncbi:MAG: DHHA1 domain-containing protein [Chloroflexi bacterium]|nr:DHHA1 domain-containing protein [Chloroflexota bacterium]